MQKVLRFDFFLSTFLMSVIFFYIFFKLQDIGTIPSLVQYSFIIFTAFLFMIVLFYGGLSLKKFLLFSPAIIFQIIYLLKLHGQMSASTIVNVIIQAVFFMLVYIVATIKWKDYQLKTLSAFSLIAFLLLLTLIIIYARTGSFSINPNGLGAYAFFLMFFPMARLIISGRKKKVLRFTMLLVVGLLAIYFSFSRTIYLSVFMALITFLGWKLITYRKLFFGLYFIFVSFIIYFITALYPKMYLWNNFHKFNELSIKYTNKPLMSGRGPLWETLLKTIESKPLFGHGAGARIGSFLDTSLSPHNIYLLIGMQVGIVGLSLFALFLFFIWMTFWKHRHNKIVAFSASFFVAIIIHQTFEVTLFQVNFGIGLIQWLIIGFALSFNFNSKDKVAAAS